MASENRCPKCNTPMETFSMILWDGSPHVEDACPLLDHDCLIKSLGRQLEEAKAVALASMERGTATDKEKCELARQLAYSESLLRASEARERELEGLAAFGLACLDEHRQDCLCGDLDGGWLQEQAIKAGVIEARNVTSPCCDRCVCAEVSDFPLTCYFDTKETEAGRAALKGVPPPPRDEQGVE